MADHPRHRLSEQATPPPNVADVRLWRLALDVAHQPDDHGDCRTAAGIPTLLVPVYPTRGLTRAHVTTVEAWLADHDPPG